MGGVVMIVELLMSEKKRGLPPFRPASPAYSAACPWPSPAIGRPGQIFSYP